MKPNDRDQARQDVAHELDRLSRLRKQQRKLIDKADRVNADNRRLTDALWQERLDKGLH